MKRTFPYNQVVLNFGRSYAYPFGAGLPDVQGSAGLCEIDPTATYTVKDYMRNRPDFTSIAYVGPLFHHTLPTIFARNQENLTMMVQHRILKKVNRGSISEWNKCLSYTAGILPLTLGNDGTIQTPLSCKQPRYPTFEQFIARWPPAKRKAAQTCLKKLCSTVYSTERSIFTYSCFQKVEKTLHASINDYPSGKRPRNISGVSRWANVLYGAWFYHYSCCMKAVWHTNNFVYYASGRTPGQLNTWFNNSLDLIQDRVIICTDFSTYDLTQGPHVIKKENMWYAKLGFLNFFSKGNQDCAGFHSRALAIKYLKSKIKSRMEWSGLTDTKQRRTLVRCLIAGLRKSGDPDTSSGNSRTTAMVIIYALRTLGFSNSQIRLAVLGDDSICMLSGKKLAAIGLSMEDLKHAVCKVLTSLGFQTKMLVTRNMENAEFLSSYFIPTMKGYRIGKKPARALLKIGAMIRKQGRSKSEYLQCLKGTLISYLPTSNHVPFLRVYLRVVLQHLTHVEARYDHIGYKSLLKQTTVYDADAYTWGAFEAKYGFNFNDELRFEGNLRTAIEKHGLNVIVHSPLLAVIAEVENGSVL